MNWGRTLGCAATAFLLLAISMSAQLSGHTTRMYDPATETTLKGTVQHVTQVEGQHGGLETGTHLDLKSGNEMYEVNVGPSPFLQTRGYKFALGDQIEVTGSKIQYQGRTIVVAREIKNGNEIMTFRDAQGIPVWFRREWAVKP